MHALNIVQQLIRSCCPCLHAAHLIQEPRLGRCLERPMRPFCVRHANRGFVAAFSVPTFVTD